MGRGRRAASGIHHPGGKPPRAGISHASVCRRTRALFHLPGAPSLLPGSKTCRRPGAAERRVLDRVGAPPQACGLPARPGPTQTRWEIVLAASPPKCHAARCRGPTRLSAGPRAGRSRSCLPISGPSSPKLTQKKLALTIRCFLLNRYFRAHGHGGGCLRWPSGQIHRRDGVMAFVSALARRPAQGSRRALAAARQNVAETWLETQPLAGAGIERAFCASAIGHSCGPGHRSAKWVMPRATSADRHRAMR